MGRMSIGQLNLEVGKIRTTLRFARDPTTVDVLNWRNLPIGW